MGEGGSIAHLSAKWGRGSSQKGEGNAGSLYELGLKKRYRVTSWGSGGGPVLKHEGVNSECWQLKY